MFTALHEPGQGSGFEHALAGASNVHLDPPVTGAFGGSAPAAMVIDPTPVYHRASIGDHGWGQGLWTSPTGPSAYDDAPSVSFLGSSLAAGTPPVGEGSNGAYFDCSLGRAGDGGGGGGAGAGGGGGGTSAGWVMGAHNPQPQAGAGGGGGGGSGGGGSRGRPGRKPHPRPEDLQSHVDALSAQFGRLSSENQFLKSKLKVG